MLDSKKEAKLRYKIKKRAEWAKSPKIPCGCGCGTLIPSINTAGNPARYVRGHTHKRFAQPLTRKEINARRRAKVKENWLKTTPTLPCACGCGELIRPFGYDGLPRKFAEDHQPRTRVKFGFCKQCGQQFKIKSGARFCSRRCANTVNPIRDRKCRRCGAVFQSRTPRIYCSQDCANKSRGESAQRWAYYQCERCGVDVKTKPYRGIRNKYRFCRTCRFDVYSEKVSSLWKGVTGENHPSYIHGNGYEPYPRVWREDLKRAIRTRDNHTCQRCGLVWVNGRKHHVHHIDYNKNNCDASNLITLCAACNIKVNANRQHWQSHFSKLMRTRGLAPLRPSSPRSP